jgi:hypothetical protein
MGIHIMPGVNLKGIQPQMIVALMVADTAYGTLGYDCILTSAVRNGTWDEVLLHGTGCAIDLSVRTLHGSLLPDRDVDVIYAQINAVLGKSGGGQYDVVDERPSRNPSSKSTGPHIHIEFDPK